MLRVFDENAELKKQTQELAALRLQLAAAELKEKEKTELADRMSRTVSEQDREISALKREKEIAQAEALKLKKRAGQPEDCF
ncbi:hypothetical protein BS78_05G154100 [Paspalum vaginatum]|nr:hypothetical protein BS78_05G154100 [Paspalum vaginatum]KAJ1275678.1 hypothetical protein BS78_05G154100 [Paspalum vaginatum]